MRWGAQRHRPAFHDFKQQWQRKRVCRDIGYYMLKKRGAILHAKRHSVAKSKVKRRRSSQFPHLIYELLARRQGPKFVSDELTQEMICVRTINEDAGRKLRSKNLIASCGNGESSNSMRSAKPAG